MERIECRIVKDLRKEYPEAEIDEETAVWNIFMELFAEKPSEKFIFVLDEWDFVFYQ